MREQCYRGVVKGPGVVILDQGADLAEGTLVTVTPVGPQPGAAAARLEVTAAETHLTQEDVDDFERAIAASDRPPSPPVPFESGTD